MYRKLLCVGVLASGLSPVFADDFTNETTSTDSVMGGSGMYFGGQLGMSNLHYGPSSGYLKSDTTTDNKKLAARGYVGYAFSQFIGLELGYDYYGYPKFSSSSGNSQNFLQQGIDFVAKASLPLDYGFGFYIKGGLVGVFRGALNRNTNTFVQQDSNFTVAPVGSIGFNYWFAPHMALDLSWTKTITVSNLPTIDFIGLGLTYKINI
jgi:OmpA-OmpF porin, OOP family